MNDFRYRSRQFGTALVAIIGAGVVVTLAVLLITGLLVLLLPLFILVLAIALFYALTVQVDERHVQLEFGRGPIRKRYALEDVVEVRPVRQPWWWGLGIRWTPRGWLYRVSGSGAVEIRFRDGKRVFIGTDEPERLAAAIEAAARSRDSIEGR